MYCPLMQSSTSMSLHCSRAKPKVSAYFISKQILHFGLAEQIKMHTIPPPPLFLFTTGPRRDIRNTEIPPSLTF